MHCCNSVYPESEKMKRGGCVPTFSNTVWEKPCASPQEWWHCFTFCISWCSTCLRIGDIWLFMEWYWIGSSVKPWYSPVSKSTMPILVILSRPYGEPFLWCYPCLWPNTSDNILRIMGLVLLTPFSARKRFLSSFVMLISNCCLLNKRMRHGYGICFITIKL